MRKIPHKCIVCIVFSNAEAIENALRQKTEQRCPRFKGISMTTCYSQQQFARFSQLKLTAGQAENKPLDIKSRINMTQLESRVKRYHHRAQRSSMHPEKSDILKRVITLHNCSSVHFQNIHFAGTRVVRALIRFQEESPTSTVYNRIDILNDINYCNTRFILIYQQSRS